MKPVRSDAEIEKIKENILEKALEIIVNEGLPSLTMRRLAKEIGMTAPNLYNYFPNKDQIYITLMIKGFENLTSELEKSVNSSDNPAERAHQFMRTYIEFGLKNPSYYEIMFTSSNPKYNDYIGTAHEALSSQEHQVSMSLSIIALQLIQEYGVYCGREVCIEKTKEIMTTLWGFLHGLVSLYKSQNIFYVIENVDEVYQRVIEKVAEQLEHIYA